MKPRTSVGDDAQDARCWELIYATLYTTLKSAEHVPFNTLHHQIQNAVIAFAQIMNLRDVRVINLGGDACLIEEHFAEGIVERDARQDRLDRDELLEAVLAG